MKAAIHQPQYLPYPGFFHKVSLVDTLVVMDDVQYDKRFTNRNRILAPQGPIWLTVPIDKSDKFRKNLEVRVNNALPWREEHWKRLYFSYRNAKWFEKYGGELQSLFEADYELLLDLDMALTMKVIDWLGLRVRVVMESELGVEGTGTARLVNACRGVGADTYVSGVGGKNYMDESLFAESGISLEYQRYVPTPYPQRFVSSFVPDLSVADMLFNVGPEAGKLVSEGGGVAPPQAPLRHPATF